MKRNYESQAGPQLAVARRLGVALLALIGLSATVRADVVTDWNVIALDAAAAAGLNPQRQHRVTAMAHVAIHDAVNSVAPKYEPYAVHVRAAAHASVKAAAVQAAYGVLIRLLPAQATMLDASRSASLFNIPDGPGKDAGVAVGETVATLIVSLRSGDGSDVDGSYAFGNTPGEYQPTPPTFGNPSIPAWRFVTPFVLKRGSQFRAEGPPSLDSDEWADEFNETKRLGSVDSGDRTQEQTTIALCGAEPALPMWNRVARSVSDQRNTSLIENARLFALLNLAMVDATIAIWDSKYAYRFWRPVTAIGVADTDGNDSTDPDPAWTPLRPTPLHPEYPSAHAGFSAAAAKILTSVFGKHVSFSTATSTCPAGVVRSYDSFQAMADEIGDSRIYIGFHFRSAVFDGANLGRQVGHWTFHRFLRPLRDGR